MVRNFNSPLFIFSRAKKRKLKKDANSEDPVSVAEKEDTARHGGWWKAKKYEELMGAVCIEFTDRCYLRALDSGLFTLGAPHNEGIVTDFDLAL